MKRLSFIKDARCLNVNICADTRCSIRNASCSYFYNSAHKDISLSVKLKFTLEQATKTQRGSRGIDLLFFNLGTLEQATKTQRGVEV